MKYVSLILWGLVFLFSCTQEAENKAADNKRIDSVVAKAPQHIVHLDSLYRVPPSARISEQDKKIVDIDSLLASRNVHWIITNITQVDNMHSAIEFKTKREPKPYGRGVLCEILRLSSHQVTNTGASVSPWPLKTRKNVLVVAEYVNGRDRFITLLGDVEKDFVRIWDPCYMRPTWFTTKRPEIVYNSAQGVLAPDGSHMYFDTFLLDRKYLPK